MAIQVFASSAKMQTDREGSLPGAGFATRTSSLGSQEVMVMHLTRNKGPIAAGNITSHAAASAIKITASVQAFVGPADFIQGWEFNFIQLLYEPTYKALYAGLTSSEGSVAVSFVGANPQFMLDTDQAFWPYTNNHKPAIRSANPYNPIPGGIAHIETVMNDHPNGFAPVEWRNIVTNKVNYLVSMQKSIHLITAFVAKDSSSNDYECLAHVPWAANWDVKVDWKKVAGQASMDFRITCTGGLVALPHEYKGAPSVASRAAMIKNPTQNSGQWYNSALQRVVGQVYGVQGNNQYIQASNQWPPGMPANFLP